jgi:hypothetical protein
VLYTSHLPCYVLLCTLFAHQHSEPQLSVSDDAVHTAVVEVVNSAHDQRS